MGGTGSVTDLSGTKQKSSGFTGVLVGSHYISDVSGVEVSLKCPKDPK